MTPHGRQHENSHAMSAIQPDDLEAAVAAGILPEAQADALRVFVARRHLAPVRSGMEDERFRFMRGFNDFFFAIGIVLLGAATIFFTGFDPLYCLAAAAFMWALSELLVRRMRLVLPGILLSVLFVFFTYQSIPTNQLIYGGQAPRVTGLDLWPMLLGMNATALSVDDQGPDRRGHCRALLLALPAAFHDPADRGEPGSLRAGGDLVPYECPFGSARIERFPRLRPCGLCRSHGFRHFGSRPRDAPGGLRILAAPARSTADRAFAGVVRGAEHHAADGPHGLGAGPDHPGCGAGRDPDRPSRAAGRRTDLRRQPDLLCHDRNHPSGKCATIRRRA